MTEPLTPEGVTSIWDAACKSIPMGLSSRDHVAHAIQEFARAIRSRTVYTERARIVRTLNSLPPQSSEGMNGPFGGWAGGYQLGLAHAKRVVFDLPINYPYDK